MSLFITFEGIEGSGKTTQIGLLNTYLRKEKKSVFLTKEPGGDKICKQIRNIILEKKHINSEELRPKSEFLLYMADRAQHTESTIIPAIKAGKIVICDRYTDSTLAYQGYARGLDIEWIEKLNYYATSGLEPDITILLDLDPVIGLKRIMELRKQKLDRMESETLEFHKKVREGYLKIAEFKQRIKIINAKQDINKVHLDIIEQLNGFINKKLNGLLINKSVKF